MAKKERSSWMLGRWIPLIFDTIIELGCSICWVPLLVNLVANSLAKGGAKQMISFVGDYLPP